MNELSRISDLKGVGDKTEKLFQKLNIYTIGDLLRYYPRGYEIYEKPVLIQDAEEGKVVTVTGNIFGKDPSGLRWKYHPRTACPG